MVSAFLLSTSLQINKWLQRKMFRFLIPFHMVYVLWFLTSGKSKSSQVSCCQCCCQSANQKSLQWFLEFVESNKKEQITPCKRAWIIVSTKVSCHFPGDHLCIRKDVWQNNSNIWHSNFQTGHWSALWLKDEGRGHGAPALLDLLAPSFMMQSNHPRITAQIVWA